MLLSATISELNEFPPLGVEQKASHTLNERVLIEIWILSVPVNDYAIGRRPVDAESGVIPSDAPPTFGHVRGRHLIEDFRVVRQRLKPMGEIFGYVNHAMIVRRKLDTYP